MKRLISVLMLSALILTGCNDNKGDSSSDTTAETTMTSTVEQISSESEHTTAEQADKTTSTSKLYEGESSSTTATDNKNEGSTDPKKSDVHTEQSTTTAQYTQHSGQDTHGNTPALSPGDEPAVTEKTDAQTTTTQAAEDSPSETLPKNDEPIELPIIPIG